MPRGNPLLAAPTTIQPQLAVHPIHPLVIPVDPAPPDQQEQLAEAAKAHEVSEATVYAWRKHFGAMDAVDVKRLRALEQENARLKKLLAERDLDVEILKEINAKKW